LIYGVAGYCDRKVAANAVAGQQDPRVRRTRGRAAAPKDRCPTGAVVIDQPLLRDDGGWLQLRIDPPRFGQQPTLRRSIVRLLGQCVRVQLDN
jgi:hypothetical protein